MDVLERIKRGYRAIGPGASRDVLAMFHQEEPEAPEWVVDDSIRVIPSRDVVAMDLFAGALPSHWEVIGVDLRMWRLLPAALQAGRGGGGSARGREAPGRSSRFRSSTSGAWTTTR